LEKIQASPNNFEGLSGDFWKISGNLEIRAYSYEILCRYIIHHATKIEQLKFK